MTEEQKPKLTEKELFERLKNLHGEIEMLTEDVRELKAEAKEEGIDKGRITYINNVAKTVAQCKTERKAEELKGFLEAIEEFA